MIARHVRVTGRVQGVFFRAWTAEQAQSLGARGWIRNCADGSVEAHVEGEPAAVEALIDRMRSGPPGAEVTGLHAETRDVVQMQGFQVRR